MDDRVFAYIGYELAHLNDQLPEERISLRAIVETDRYRVKTKTGSHYLEKDEVAFLKEFVPKEFWNKISLPLVFFRRKETYTFSGTVYECFLIKKLIADEAYTRDVVIGTDKEITLYTPQIIELKKRFKSIFVVGFSM